MNNNGLNTHNMASSSKAPVYDLKGILSTYMKSPVRPTETSPVSGKRGDVKGKGKAVDNGDYDPSIPLPVPAGVSSASRFQKKTPEQQRKPPHADTPLRGSFGASGEIRCDSMSYFFDYVLPPIRPEFDIDRIVVYCLENETLKRGVTPGELYWEGFSQGSEDSRDHETNIPDMPFVNIFNAITKAAQETSGSRIFPTTHLRANKNNSIWSEGNSKIEPDAQLYLNDPHDTYPESLEGRHWYNAALSVHFKKARKESHDNIKRVLHSLRHCMSIDPCRRFNFGATVEGTRFTLWAFSRSMIIASDPFDINADPLTLIKVVLSLVFAEKVELGWDPTITARCNGTEREFTIDINGNGYKTDSSNIISDIKADGIFTAGTRIFKAFRGDDTEGKEPLIIKDYWPSDKNETEDITLQKILADIKGDAEREAVEALTLTPIISGRVKVGDREDHTRITILRDMDPKSAYIIPLPGEELGTKVSTLRTPEGYKKDSDGSHQQKAASLELNRSFTRGHRWHYRIAYKEVAIPYHKLRNVKDMGFVLYCAVSALRYIHEAGWVHRDISPGNLYLYTDPITGEKRGLIGDFEFAKRVGAGEVCDSRTGTPDFIAIEVAAQAYRFKPKTRNRRIWTREEGRRVYNKKGIWANYIHDLESIWWIAVWTLFSFQKASKVSLESKSYKEMIRIQACYHIILFPGTTVNEKRPAFFTEDDVFGDVLDRIPDDLQELGSSIMGIREMLLDCYTDEALKGFDPIRMTNGGSLHGEMMEALKRVSNDPIEVVPVDVNINVLSKPITSLKRTTINTRSDDCPPPEMRMVEPCDPKVSGTSPQHIPGDSKSKGSALGLDSVIVAPRNNVQGRKPETPPKKTRSVIRRAKPNTGTSPTPITRTRGKNPTVIDKDSAQTEDRIRTRSMVKNTVEAAVTKGVETRSSKRAISESHVTHSKTGSSTKKARKTITMN